MTRHDDARPAAVDHEARFRRIPGAFNLRDLGGLPASADRWVRPGFVFRGDYPSFGDADEQAVRSLGLRTVVDLRRGTEAAYECVAWEQHGVQYLRCPISAGDTSSWHARYAGYLLHRPTTVVAAVRRVLDPAAHPVLFHCAAGKDRTGVVAALVHAVLGVPRDLIVDDYLLTAPSVPAVLARLRAAGPYADMLAGDSDADQAPQAAHLRSLLDHLEDAGGAEAWLLDHGLTPAEIATGRGALLT